MFQFNRGSGNRTSAAKILALSAMCASAVCGHSALASADRLASTSGVVVLDSRATDGALTFTGTVHINVQTIFVNSSSERAVVGNGNGIIETPALNVVGGTQFNGTAACTGTIVSAPGPMLDPYAATVMPAFDVASPIAKLTINGGSRTLNPGSYSGIMIKGGASVTFSPGVYILNDDFSLTSGSVVGEGVTIVMLSGKFSMGGNATKALSAPTTGPYAGIVIAQPATNTSNMSISGGAEMNISGAIWAPGAAASITGSSSVYTSGPGIGDSLVVKTLSVNGSGVVRLGRPSDQVVPPQVNGLHD